MGSLGAVLARVVRTKPISGHDVPLSQMTPQ
jgi:hypothetical protein